MGEDAEQEARKRCFEVDREGKRRNEVNKAAGFLALISTKKEDRQLT
jgi:hypothetical protein